jgi:regulator of RNase E activity RraA
LFAGTLAAQTVHLVGPGGFATIQAAISAAANGDVVVIQSGSYTAFTLAKDLTLTAAPGAIVDIVTALW